MSLWCVCFASAEARCHICHVCLGFYSLLLIILYRPQEGTGLSKHELASSRSFSSRECIGAFLILTFFPLYSLGVTDFTRFCFGGPFIFNSILEITNSDHDP